MNINEGRGKRLVAKKLLYGEEVGTILIKVGSERMAEGMAGEFLFPAKFLFV